MDNQSLLLGLIGLLIALAGLYYAYKQYTHQKEEKRTAPDKEKDIIINVNPDFKFDSHINVNGNNSSNNAQPIETSKMDEDYYLRLGVKILRSKKPDDEFDINEIK